MTVDLVRVTATSFGPREGDPSAYTRRLIYRTVLIILL